MADATSILTVSLSFSSSSSSLIVTVEVPVVEPDDIVIVSELKV